MGPLGNGTQPVSRGWIVSSTRGGSTWMRSLAHVSRVSPPSECACACAGSAMWLDIRQVGTGFAAEIGTVLLPGCFGRSASTDLVCGARFFNADIARWRVRDSLAAVIV